MINNYIKKMMYKHSLVFSRIHIPVEKVLSASSLSDLSQEYAIPIELVNSLIIEAIYFLLREYHSKAREILPQVITYRMFRQLPSQLDITQLLSVCSQVVNYTEVINQERINIIKSLLELNLFSSKLQPEDNFLKIVKAIANYSAGIDDWKFSLEAMNKLNQIESSANRHSF